MIGISQLRLGLGLIGLILWGYGVRAENSMLRITGIAFLAVTLALRFWRRKVPPPSDRGGPPTTGR